MSAAPAEALCHALVAREWSSEHVFLAANERFRRRVQLLEARVRRRDLLDDEMLFDFYDERIGDEVVSGRQTFLAGHVPGADFLDLQGELSASGTRLMFMMPSVEQLAVAFGRHGLGDGCHVVLYSIGSMMWATRVWWMLRALGFDRVELDPEAKGLISKYGLGSLVVYDSKARQQRAEAAYVNFDQATYSSTGRSLWSSAKGLANAAMMAMSLRVTVSNLIGGQHIECKDLDELLGAESAIVEACKNLKAYIETALTFDGREELLEF